MNTTPTMPLDHSPPGVDLPLAAQMLTGAVSAVGGLLAVMHGEYFVHGQGSLIALLYVHATLLAVVAHALAAATHERLARWEARLAPVRAQARVRADLLRACGRAAALGLAGPLALAGVVAWQRGDASPLLGTFAVSGTVFCASFGAANAWRGRAPRWLLVPALAALVLVLVWPGNLSALCNDSGLALLSLAFAAALGWRCLLARGALVVCTRPLPTPDLQRWWRRASAQRGWMAVRYQRPWKTLTGETRHGGSWAVVALLPQFFTQAQWLELLAWGRSYTHVYAGAGYALWMISLVAFAYAGLIAPRLHWRRRLAPQSLSALRWARRLVLGSMAAGVVLASLGIGLAMWANALASRPLHGDAWLPVLGDVLLATSFGAWLRGRHEREPAGWMLLFGVGLALAAALPALSALGVEPRRGALWLLLQLALVLLLTRAAILAWNRRDLNLMA